MMQQDHSGSDAGTIEATEAAAGDFKGAGTLASRDIRVAPTGGRVSGALLRLLSKPATVVDNERIADGFQLITLESSEFRGLPWTPGHKVQIAMGSAFVSRTYTPIDWDSAKGRTRILAYAHGSGPGSQWANGVVPGQVCNVLGPRGSINTERMAPTIAVFGDETSIGFASALAGRDARRQVICHFEVDERESSNRAATQLGLHIATLHVKAAGEAHLQQMELALHPLAEAGASFVLTGKASSIQRWRQELKRHSVQGSRIAAKAYWAPGKTGLD